MEAIEQAAHILGSHIALADLCGVSKGAVSQWKGPGRRVPAEYCPLIERATGGQVRCEQLRPDVAWDVLRMQAGEQFADQKAVGQFAQQPAARDAFVKPEDDTPLDNTSK